ALAERYKEAASTSVRLAPDPTSAANQFFGTLLYDDFDDGASLFNAVRGHSVARAMYGSNPDPTVGPWAGNTVPWGGVGLFDEDAGAYNPALAGVNRARMVNHTLTSLNGAPFLLDPEWTGHRGLSTPIPAAGPVPALANPATLARRAYNGKHAGYTYPDVKNFFLAQQDPATGEVLTPSFYRDWIFGGLQPGNLNWTNEVGKFLILRPRPAEHPRFPRVGPNADGTYSGDVQNLPGALGAQRNDSLWMHLGLPPVTLDDGRIVQPMVAPLVLPLDGRFNLSVHGNQLGATLATPPPVTHLSQGGLGAWEINHGYGVANEPERAGITNNRPPSTNGQPAQSAFDPYTIGGLLPLYAPVPWGNAQPRSFTPPAGNSMAGLPLWANYDSNNVVFTPHSSGYNPTEFLPQSDVSPGSPV
ncbi:MAG: hypothetical protein K2V38_00045, partial [Gemmataceae bacterium]|nr:hypothetical protein [Gemmataceae bacterium]